MKKEEKLLHIEIARSILRQHDLDEEQRKSLLLIIEEFGKKESETDYVRIALEIAKLIGLGVTIYSKSN